MINILLSSAFFDAIESLIEDYQDFNTSYAQEFDSFDELRSVVQHNIPALFKGVARNWEARRKWDDEYLSNSVQGDIEIATTPYGNADALVEVGDDVFFVEPLNQHISMGDFLQTLHNKKDDVVYLQSQNGNLAFDEFLKLGRDVPASIAQMEDIMGSKPDAVNVWMGGPESVTSLHHDPYENIYVVVRGTKTFNLFPPTEEYCLGFEKYRRGKYIRDASGKLIVEAQDEHVPWTPIDPCLSKEENIARVPQYKHSRCMTVTVNEGDALYLPSGWFHHVLQSGDPCIAINYWFDQSYEGEQYSMRQFYNRMIEVLHT
ncbi:hypothetical protein E3P96_00466 [Wallemia ichthyophaga]|nr:hypothetical protein E3P96_00466 [Wallemia ichthyophaga]